MRATLEVEYCAPPHPPFILHFASATRGEQQHTIINAVVVRVESSSPCPFVSGRPIPWRCQSFPAGMSLRRQSTSAETPATCPGEEGASSIFLHQFVFAGFVFAGRRFVFAAPGISKFAHNLIALFTFKTAALKSHQALFVRRAAATQPATTTAGDSTVRRRSPPSSWNSECA